MNAAGRVSCVYHCPPALVWLKERGRTIVVDQKRMESWQLGGLQAVVWDLVTLGYPFGRIARLVAALLDVSRDEADGTVLTILARWEEAGMVRREGDAA
jgi:hypothetical protein